jgi:hypothetical protein
VIADNGIRSWARPSRDAPASHLGADVDTDVLRATKRWRDRVCVEALDLAQRERDLALAVDERPGPDDRHRRFQSRRPDSNRGPGTVTLSGCGRTRVLWC